MAVSLSNILQYSLRLQVTSKSVYSNHHICRFVSPQSCMPSSRSFRQSAVSRQNGPRLTPQDVTTILHGNQFTSGPVPGYGPVASYDMSSLRSNFPIEDAHSASFLLTKEDNGMLFGIFDGHGGAACGQVVAKRLHRYIAAGLLSIEELQRHIDAVENNDTTSPYFKLTKSINDEFELSADLQEIYHKSYIEYLRLLKAACTQRADYDEAASVSDSLIQAFQSLDDDLGREAIPANIDKLDVVTDKDINMKTVTVAQSGAVAVTALIDGPMLHVASCGDCVAVLGSLSENDTWVATKLTTEHNTDNENEVERILSEHPAAEANDIFKGDRLLGMLAPLRAFGDFKFKWPGALCDKLFGGVLGKHHFMPNNYKTPPYLTVVPEVTTHHLTARDKFLVIGTDGLWDMMTPMQVIRLVGEHMSGKITMSPLVLGLEEQELNLAQLRSLLRHRQNAMKLQPADSNAATHLVRCALGGTAYGVDHGRLSQMLSLPQDMVRMFRDDITITVVFFDSEYLRHS